MPIVGAGALLFFVVLAPLAYIFPAVFLAFSNSVFGANDNMPTAGL